MFTNYFLNFWIWWYLVVFKKCSSISLRFINNLLDNLNILPMLSNLFVPMFQDHSATGKFISFLIRLLWVIWGSVIFFTISVFPIVFLIIILILPFFLFFSLIISIF